MSTTSNEANDTKLSAREIELEKKLNAALARNAELESQVQSLQIALSHKCKAEAASVASHTSRKKAKISPIAGSSLLGASGDIQMGENKMKLESEVAMNTPFPLPDDLLPLVLKFLDPGLDWTQCRLVCQTWHTCILSIDKKPGLWMAPLRLNNASGWNDRLKSDLAKVQPVPASEREQLLDERDDDDPAGYHLWRRTDVPVNEYGMCLLHPHDRDAHLPPIVSARLALCVRGARELIDAKGEWTSDAFSFAGTWWHISVGANQRVWNDGSGGWRFGVDIHRCDAPGIKDKHRSDPTKLDLDSNIPCAIRYQASFTVGASTLKAGDFTLRGPVENRFKPSCVADGGGYVCEYFPLSVAEFALGPSCPDLYISIDLEHLGYAYVVV